MFSSSSPKTHRAKKISVLMRIPFGDGYPDESQLEVLRAFRISVEEENKKYYLLIPDNCGFTCNVEHPYVDMNNYTVSHSEKIIITVAEKTNVLKKYDGHVIPCIFIGEMRKVLRDVEEERLIDEDILKSTQIETGLSDYQRRLYSKINEFSKVFFISVAHDRDFGADFNEACNNHNVEGYLSGIRILKDENPEEFDNFFSDTELKTLTDSFYKRLCEMFPDWRMPESSSSKMRM